MKALIPEPAYDLVNQKDLFQQAIERQEWSRALLYTDSQYALPLFLCLWDIIPASARPSVLAEALSGCEMPSICLTHVLIALRWCVRRNRRAFDSDSAERLFNELPAEVDVYRGTIMDEYTSGQLGACWSLSRDVATFFGRDYARYGNRVSPVILWGRISTKNVCGIASERDEQEVWLVPSMCWSGVEGLGIELL